jgi:DNA-directed RNA polymerase subunit RPC12/RpoP
MEKTKRCSTCGKALTLDHFSKRASAKDGLQYSCKDCNAKAALKRLAHKDEKTIAHPEMGRREEPNPLASFSVKEIIDELRKRNYRGTLECVHTVRI